MPTLRIEAIIVGQALNTVLGHEIQDPRRSALDRLPSFHRQACQSRHQRQILQHIAAIRHLRRQRVMLALVAERLIVEGLEDNIDLFLEQLAICLLIQQMSTKVSTSRK